MQPDERKGPAGRSLVELTTPRSLLMPPVEVFDGELQRIEASLRPSVPEEIRKRITTTRNLAVYGAFSYDFFAVSVYWSLTCVEMALWAKSQEIQPMKHHRMTTLRLLLEWASKEGLLPEHLKCAMPPPTARVNSIPGSMNVYWW
jgi:hypothetical protein